MELCEVALEVQAVTGYVGLIFEKYIIQNPFFIPYHYVQLESKGSSVTLEIEKEAQKG